MHGMVLDKRRQRPPMRPGRRSAPPPLLAVMLLVLVSPVLALAACSGASPAVPKAAGGTYASQQYHFSVTYPAGWQATVGQQSSTIVPLTLVITRVHSSTAAEGGAVSTFTVTIFDAHNAAIAQSVTALAGDKTLARITLSGRPAYQATAIQQPAQGSQLDDTHRDYYLPAPDYEYQLSTDAISGDGADAALQSMLTSFKILK